MTTERTPAPVAVVGLGPMGQAVTRTLLAGGHPVTVWNRTPQRADPLVERGAVRAASLDDALHGAELVVVTLTAHQTMYEVMDGVAAGALAGKVIANLSTDTPRSSRRAAAWADERRARFLSGGVVAGPTTVGTAEAFVYYSGPRDAFAAHEATLRLIGAARYLGEDPGVALSYYQAQMAVYLTTVSGLLQGAALARSAGVAVAEFLPDALAMVTDLPSIIGGTEEAARQLDAGSYGDEIGATAMVRVVAEQVVSTSEEAGVDASVSAAVRAQYERAVAAGHGPDNYISIFEVIRNPDRAGTPR